MALHVNYKNRMGYCYLHSRGDENRKWKVWFCHANALCALMYFYRDEDKANMAQLNAFFVDVKHAERCIKDGIFGNYSGFVFFAKELTSDMWKLIKKMTENGIKVTIR